MEFLLLLRFFFFSFPPVLSFRPSLFSLFFWFFCSPFCSPSLFAFVDGTPLAFVSVFIPHPSHTPHPWALNKSVRILSQLDIEHVTGTVSKKPYVHTRHTCILAPHRVSTRKTYPPCLSDKHVIHNLPFGRDIQLRRCVPVRGTCYPADRGTNNSKVIAGTVDPSTCINNFDATFPWGSAERPTGTMASRLREIRSHSSLTVGTCESGNGIPVQAFKT